MFTRRLVLTGLAATSAAALVPWRAPGRADQARRRRPRCFVIDVQNCFMPGGSLPVQGRRPDRAAHQPPRQGLQARGADAGLAHRRPCLVRLAQHPGKKPFDTIELPYGTQVLWPEHCVQGTEGAALSKDLAIPHAGLVIRKGFHKKVDSYSAFTEADGKTTTGLAAYLKARKVKRLFLAGLATDFCVAWTRARRAQGAALKPT